MLGLGKVWVYNCDYCKEVFDSTSAIKNHYKNVHPNKPMMLPGRDSSIMSMAIWVVEFSNGGYKIRKIFALESTYPKDFF